jgi:hypothetical protein
MSETDRKFRRDTIENYKLVVQYMHDNKVPFNIAVDDLGSPKTSMYTMRKKIIDNDLNMLTHTSPEERDELKRLTEWSVNVNPEFLMKHNKKVKRKKARAAVAKTKTKTKKRAYTRRATATKATTATEKTKKVTGKVVCIVGDAKDVAKSLAELFG